VIFDRRGHGLWCAIGDASWRHGVVGAEVSVDSHDRIVVRSPTFDEPVIACGLHGLVAFVDHFDRQPEKLATQYGLNR
jgi:hypothetical protein